jgi:ABC-type lipoprotein release transport system permease subunit
MTRLRLLRRNLLYYWRTNGAVVLGVATAVAVLTGALLVGDSVRGSLRDLVLQRLGRADYAVLSAGFFRERLADDLRNRSDFDAAFDAVCPLVSLQGFVTDQSSGQRAGNVQVYGVDDRFWRLHGASDGGSPADREALISPALARDLATRASATVLVRVRRPSVIPIDSVHGRKDDLGRTIRATVREVLPVDRLGEFSLQSRQGDVRAIFLPLARVQQDLEIGARVNTLLLAAKTGTRDGAGSTLERAIAAETRLDDLGLRLRPLDRVHAVALETDAGLLNDAQVKAAGEAAASTGVRALPIFTYLANAIRSGGREVPYSLVTAVDLRAIAPDIRVEGATDPPPILLNEWAARDLGVTRGADVTLEFYVWKDSGQLETRTARFRLEGIVPTAAGDRDLVPVYPGITESSTVADWDPPFPIDLRRIRAIDEQYWREYRTTPKAFIPLEAGQRLWASRHGALTSIRFAVEPEQPLADARRVLEERLRARVNPLAVGIAVRDVRAEGLDASRGATDFGAYFVYFSFFLVASAVLLAGLFFKLTIDQRAREVGLLRAVGYGPRAVGALFAAEGLVLAVAGSAAGSAGGVGYAQLLMRGLRTTWRDAVGTDALALHVAPASLVIGALSGVAAALACIWIALRSLARLSERSLLAGQLGSDVESVRRSARPRRLLFVAIACAVAGASLMVAAALDLIGKSAGFFAAGAALLVACVCLFAWSVRRPTLRTIAGHGWRPLARLGLRNAARRPSRSVLTLATIASAAFIVTSVDAFRRDGRVDVRDPRSGVGGYSLFVESLLPVAYDPNTPEGRDRLGLVGVEDAAIEPFRLRPGDDASCLNLYAPKHPRILAPTERFVTAGRFAFRQSLAATEAERANPWLLLNRAEPDGAVPVIADANSMTYVLHRKLGDVLTLDAGGRPVRLRLVAALDDSLFQSELLMAPHHFVRLFPEQQGYRVFLVGTPPDRAPATARAIEDALADSGADAIDAVQRLSEFHRVENTYLSTFQVLGGLGLLLGTLGLGAVLARNILEQRRELALLGALGYRRGHFFTMAFAEHGALLAGGLLAGTACALLAIAPVFAERPARLPAISIALLVGGGIAIGLITALVATAVSIRSALLSALRSE